MSEENKKKQVIEEEEELYTPINYPPETPLGQEKEIYGEFTPSEFRKSSGEVTLEKEIKEVDDIFKNCISQPDNYNPLIIEASLTPKTGLYKDHTHTFRLEFGSHYPFVPPKVKSVTRCYNPWINTTDGSVCLDLINEDIFEPEKVGLNEFLNGILALFNKETVQVNKDEDSGKIFNEKVFLEFKNNYEEFSKKARLCMSEFASKK